MFLTLRMVVHLSNCFAFYRNLIPKPSNRLTFQTHQFQSTPYKSKVPNKFLAANNGTPSTGGWVETASRTRIARTAASCRGRSCIIAIGIVRAVPIARLWTRTGGTRSRWGTAPIRRCLSGSSVPTMLRSCSGPTKSLCTFLFLVF